MKMKSLFAFASVVVALTACSNNEEVGVNNNFPEDGVIRVMTNVGNPETRAGITADDIQYFNLNIENERDANYSYYAVIQKDDTGGWRSYEGNGSTPLTMLWKNSTTPVTVTALSQIGLSVGTKEEFTEEQRCSVENDQATNMGIHRSDVLYMKPTNIDPATDLVDGKLKVSFVHFFSKINLAITLGTEFNTVPGTATNPITGMKVNGAKGSINFTPSTGQFTPIDIQPEAITPWYDADNYTGGSGDNKNAVAKYEVILPPQTVESGNFSITFTIGGKDYEWKSTKAITLESGYAYTLELTAGKGIVNVKNLTATAWDEQTEGSIATE